MEKTVTRDQMNTILEGRPKGVSGKEIIDTYVANGYKVEGINYEKPEPQKESGLSRVASIYSKNLKEQALGGVENAQKSFGMGVDTMQQAQQMPMDTQNQKDKAFTTATAGAGQIGVGAMSGTIQTAFSPITAAILTGIQGYKELDQATGGKIQNQLSTLAQSHPEIIKSYSDMVTQNPKTAQFVMDSINVLTAGLGTKPLVTATKNVVGDTLTGIKNVKGVSVPEVKNLVPTNLGQKAVDLISQDPGKKVETILKRTAPEELNSYLSIAEKSSLSGEAKSVFETVGDKLADTTKTLKTKLDDIGAAKSSIIENTPEGRALFKNETTPFIQKLTDIKNGISEIDRANAPKVQAIINDANAIVTKKDADLFIDKVQDALYSGNLDMTIPRGSSLDNKLRGILGEYNNTLKATLPSEYTTLNQQYSKLVDTLDVINRSLGEVVEGTPIRGAGLIKQYFSPAGSKAKEIFEFIKKETNGEVDLAKDATLAKFAGQLYDDPNVGSLLGGIKDIPTSLGAVAGRLIEKIGGEKVESAMRQSTIRKAREKFSPKLEEGSSLKTTTPIESKLSPSPNSTPKEIKGKGIRGMINFDEIIKSIIPTKKLATEAKNAASQLDSTISFVKEAKSPQAIKDFRKELSDLMTSMGRETVITESNYKKVIQEADDMLSQLKAHIKSSEKQSANDIINRDFSKNKVVSSLEQEAKKYKSDGFKTDGKTITLYRGIGGNSKLEGNYFTGDKNYANEFTQSGLPEQLKQVKVNMGDIYRPKVLPEAVNSKEMEITIKEAKQKGYKAILVDENGADTPSVFFIDKVSKDFYK